MQIVDIPSHFGGGKQTPNLVVIHAMGEFLEAGEVDYFAKDFLDKLGYSAHFLVTPSGVVIRCRQLDEVSYHAKGHNVGSIGIEVLVPGVWTYGSFLERIKTSYMFEKQYAALVELCRTKELRALPYKRHSDLSPGRKFDPGDGFNYQQFIDDVKS